MNKIPSKINNLYFLKKMGLDVPPFFVIDENFVKNLSSNFNEVKNFFKDRKNENVIIRSASSFEDGGDISKAGFFESSGKIKLEDFTEKEILKYWNKNKKKSNKDLFLFIQEYFKADYFGVLFSEDLYDKDFFVLNLSKEAQAITDGKKAKKKIKYDKKNRKWFGDSDLLSENIKEELLEIVSKIENEFENGTDIELGIKGDIVKFFQARPITRSENDKIVLCEKKRLKEKFGKDFEKQIWEKNNFSQALGKLSEISLDFYNKILNSGELQNLLFEAKFIDRKKKDEDEIDVLENIVGNIYFNTYLEKKLFHRRNGKFSEFIRIVFMLANEKIMQKKSIDFLKSCHLGLAESALWRNPRSRIGSRGEDEGNEIISYEESFSWFFLSGIYFQYFLNKDRKKYSSKDFLERLKNTEIKVGAIEPRPKSVEKKDIEKFAAKYYFLSENPYELLGKRIGDMSIDEVKIKYKDFLVEESGSVGDDLLGKNTQSWLSQKVFWKHVFLKNLCRQKEKEFFPQDNSKLDQKSTNCHSQLAVSALWRNWESSNEGIEGDNKTISLSPQISAKNFPFPEKTNNEEVIIVPGSIDFENIVKLSPSDDITKHFGKYIQVEHFPSNWIPYIPKLKGIVLKEGNELSHMAITCREYEVPCFIKIPYKH